MIRDGSVGTAMKSFSGILSDSEIEDVAIFVFDRFVQRGAVNTYYHTAENGWPTHRQRYKDAYPFALGELPVDIPASALSEAQRHGLRLFQETCVTCHENQALTSGAREWRVTPEPPLKRIDPARDVEQDEDVKNGGYDREKTAVHDRAPDLPNLSAEESRGATLYQAACAQCHAADGTGENWIGEFLRPHPPDFTAAQSRHLTDDVIARAIMDGLPQTSMPSFRGAFDGEDVKAVIAYMKRAFLGNSAEQPDGAR